MDELSLPKGSEGCGACDDARLHVVLPSSPSADIYQSLFRMPPVWVAFFFCFKRVHDRNEHDVRTSHSRSSSPA